MRDNLLGHTNQTLQRLRKGSYFWVVLLDVSRARNFFKVMIVSHTILSWIGYDTHTFLSTESIKLAYGFQLSGTSTMPFL